MKYIKTYKIFENESIDSTSLRVYFLNLLKPKILYPEIFEYNTELYQLCVDCYEIVLDANDLYNFTQKRHQNLKKRAYYDQLDPKMMNGFYSRNKWYLSNNMTDNKYKYVQGDFWQEFSKLWIRFYHHPCEKPMMHDNIFSASNLKRMEFTPLEIIATKYLFLGCNIPENFNPSWIDI